MELTKAQIDRQDFVDNTIFSLLQDLNPSNEEINWDIEFIGELRDLIKNRFIELQLSNIENFYPEIDE